MITRVISHAKAMPSRMETKDSVGERLGTPARAGCPQYGLLRKECVGLLLISRVFSRSFSIRSALVRLLLGWDIRLKQTPPLLTGNRRAYWALVGRTTRAAESTNVVGQYVCEVFGHPIV